MIVIGCTDCHWIGGDHEIRNPGFCPNCNLPDTFILLHPTMKFTQNELKILWSLFGEVPINDRDEIEEDFLDFSKGTDRFEVWHWFDNRFKGGVAALSGLTTF